MSSEAESRRVVVGEARRAGTKDMVYLTDAATAIHHRRPITSLAPIRPDAPGRGDATPTWYSKGAACGFGST
jgi:hypothetical protein